MRQSFGEVGQCGGEGNIDPISHSVFITLYTNLTVITYLMDLYYTNSQITSSTFVSSFTLLKTGTKPVQ